MRFSLRSGSLDINKHVCQTIPPFYTSEKCGTWDEKGK